MNRRWLVALSMVVLIMSEYAHATKVYVSNEEGNSVSIFDTSTNTVVGIVDASVARFLDPSLSAITPDNKTVYVPNFGNDTTNLGFVSIIDAVANRVIGTVTDLSVPTFNGPIDIAIAPNGAFGYVANNNNNSISVIDLALNAVIKQITDVSFNIPTGIAISADGTSAYVVNFSGGTISVIDLLSNTVTMVLTVGSGPITLVITPDGTRAYVTNFLSNSVSVINLITNTVSLVTGSFSGPNGMAISPDGSKAYVCNESNGSVSVISLTTNSVIKTITIGASTDPADVIFTQDGSSAYVTETEKNGVIVINALTDTVEGSVTDLVPATFHFPQGIILVPAPLTGTQKKNKFLTQTDYINSIDWSASVSGTFAAYAIYRDAASTALAGTVPGNGPLLFLDHNRNPQITNTYYVVAVNENGTGVHIGSVTVAGNN